MTCLPGPACRMTWPRLSFRSSGPTSIVERVTEERIGALAVLHSPSSSIAGASLSRGWVLVSSSLLRVLSNPYMSSLDVGSFGWLLESPREVVAAVEVSTLSTLVESSVAMWTSLPGCVVLADVARASASPWSTSASSKSTLWRPTRA